MVPTWKGLQGFSSACRRPKQWEKGQDEDEQSKAVQLGGVLQKWRDTALPESRPPPPLLGMSAADNRGKKGTAI